MIKIVKVKRLGEDYFEVWFVREDNDHDYIRVFAKDELGAFNLARKHSEFLNQRAKPQKKTNNVRRKTR